MDILHKCCESFQKEFLEITGIDPLQYVTIASACMGVYQTLHLEPNTIGVVPSGGYVHNINTSKISLEWMSYVEKQLGKYIFYIQEKL